MRLRVVVVTHVVIAVLAVGPVSAQETTAQREPQRAPKSGAVTMDRVSVRVAGSAREIRGRLIHLGSHTLTLQVDNDADGGPARATIDLPIGRVLQIDREEHDPLLDGAILGAIFLAACAKWWCGQGTSGPAPSPWLGAGLGALVGAGIDSALYGRTMIFGPGTPPRAGAARVGVTFAFRF